jgi:hypothetical protein
MLLTTTRRICALSSAEIRLSPNVPRIGSRLFIFGKYSDAAPQNGTGGTNGGGGPNCTQELCMIDEMLSANCQREYDSCITTGTLSQPECIAFAEETCTI